MCSRSISRVARETYARELRLALDDPAIQHRTLTLFRSDPAALRPDFSLDVPTGIMRRGLDPRVLYRLRRTLRREKPDIVVAHGGEPLKYAVLAGVPKKRLVYYKIGIGGERLRGPSGVLHRSMLRRVDTIAAVSRRRRGRGPATATRRRRCRGHSERA